MHKRSVLVLLAALVLVGAVAIGVSMAADSDFDATHLKPYTAGHADSGDGSQANCSSCHTPGSGGGANAHATHARTTWLSFKDKGGVNDGCGRCHEKTNPSGYAYEGDLSYTEGNGYTGKIRKQVDPSVCQRCHGKFVSVASGNGHVGKSITSNCLTSACHGPGGPAKRPAVGHSGKTWISVGSTYTSNWRNCTLCHGGNGSILGYNNRVYYQTEELNTAWP